MSERPNVVLIVLDAVRRDHLSCYGHRRFTTPNIDRIAAQGVRFTRASAASCWTLPSHASLFTGLYPSEHRADVDTWQLGTGPDTLAGHLAAQGYRTACISCNGLVSSNTRLTRGFQVATDVERLRGGREDLRQRAIRGAHARWRRLTRRDRGATRATALAQDFLRSASERQPFFLFLNYMDCHLPYNRRLATRNRFVDDADRRRVARVPQDPFAVMAGALTMAAQDLIDLQALYDGSLYHLDAQVGALFATLDGLGLADRTWFIVTSDHGESFGEHGLLDHQYGLYEELVAVPFVLRLPAGERAGTVDERLVQHVDLFPTLAHRLSDGDPPAHLPGVSMLDDEPGRNHALAEYRIPNLRQFRRRFPTAGIARFDAGIRSIRTDRHKLIEWTDGRVELYDLAADPGECANQASGRPDVVADLQATLRQRLGPWSNEPAPEPSDAGVEQLRERLQLLGYL
ncbi:MAG: sulfatase family protein [Longimicrobiales bacterium]